MPSALRVIRSLRFRLTATATVLVVLVLSLTAAALLGVQRHELTANLDSGLEQRADTITDVLSGSLGSTPLNTNDEDRAIQVVSSGGEVLVATENLVGDPAIGAVDVASQKTVIRTRDDLPLEDDSYRVLSRPVTFDGEPAVLFVAENTDDLNEALRNLARGLAILVPSVALFVAMLLWWLTGRTLKPVETIRSEVDAITSTKSGRRVHVPARDDEITRLATTMNAMLDRLGEATERQRRFVADAAHELRTPLARIRTTVEVDLAQPAGSDAELTNRTVRNEIIGLEALIDDLLHLARADDGYETTLVPVDLDDLVLDEAAYQRALGTELRLDVSGVSGAHMLGDASQLTRVVRNLVTNALRHANEVVTITLEEVDDVVQLCVADDGPGVAPADRERIFLRFARADDARSREHGGVGLGLAITKSIVEGHGGTIAYDAQWDAGARFVVRFPATK